MALKAFLLRSEGEHFPYQPNRKPVTSANTVLHLYECTAKIATDMLHTSFLVTQAVCSAYLVDS
jgi:hypothetical protein